MPTAVDSVITALVAAFTAALPGVEVNDGPPVTAPGVTEFVLVGHDATPDADTTITVDQESADLAATSRYERGAIPCCVMAQTGDVDIPGRRLRAAQLLAACETTLRTDRSLGGAVMVAQLESGSLHQVSNGDGTAVIAQFTVTYMAQV